VQGKIIKIKYTRRLRSPRRRFECRAVQGKRSAGKFEKGVEKRAK